METIRAIKVEGGTHGFAHPDCAEMVADDIRGDFPDMQVWTEAVSHFGAHRDRDKVCIGCGEEITA